MSVYHFADFSVHMHCRCAWEGGIAEHFIFYLAWNGYLNEGYVHCMKFIYDVFINDYLPKFPINIFPFDLYKCLIQKGCIDMQQSFISHGIFVKGLIVFNRQRVNEIVSTACHWITVANNRDSDIYDPDDFINDPYWRIATGCTDKTDLHSEKLQTCKDILHEKVSDVCCDQLVATGVSVKHLEINKTRCETCDENFPCNDAYNEHILSELHKLKLGYRSNMLSKPNQDIKVHFKSVESDEIITRQNENKIHKLHIQNDSALNYKIIAIHLLHDENPLAWRHDKLPMLLNQGNRKEIELEGTFKEPGVYVYPLILVLYCMNQDLPLLYCLKEIIFTVQSEEFDDLRALAPFKRLYRSPLGKKDIFTVRAEQILQYSGMRYKRKLKEYKLNDALIQVFENNFKEVNLSSAYNDELRSARTLLGLDSGEQLPCLLKEETYSKYFSLLLYMEEHQILHDISTYDLKHQKVELVTFDNKRLLSVEVPDLPDNPFVLPGGTVNLIPEGNEDIRYEGILIDTKYHTFWLSVGKAFLDRYWQTGLNDMKFTVEFNINRSVLRLYHRALEMVERSNITDPLFPTEFSKRPRKIALLPWYNRLLNRLQKKAVINIVRGTAFPAPYIIYGPPGTGKTWTLVEAIIQVYKLKLDAYILVCTKSNCRADYLANTMLKYVESSDLLRLYPVSRDPSKIPADLLSCCNYSNATGLISYPSKEEIQRYSIVICSLITSGGLVSIGVKPGHFTHLFVNDCGRTIEPEMMIPIAGLFSSEEKPGKLLGDIVLAGDPKQLGPTVYSRRATKYGLGKSFLERLMTTCRIYQKDEVTGEYEKQVITKLTQNYRSHEKILAISNKAFYEAELQALGDRKITRLAVNWKGLPNKQFPMLFHGIKGKNQREGKSASYFNVSEIEIVISYIRHILKGDFNGHKISQNEIGVMATYRKQVQKIKIILEKMGWHEIFVGSVDKFQSQEKSIVIISTVRSKVERLSEDNRFSIGFLRNPKRFNVAITRSKALLIVVGNPNVLQLDPYWRELILFCKDNGAYIGCPFELEAPLPRRKKG